MKVLWFAGVCGLVQILVLGPAMAKENTSAGTSSRSVFYFEAQSSNGEPVNRPVGCGSDGARKDSFSRDLGQGVSLTVIPTYSDAKRLSVNLIFNYREKGGLTIAPEKFELHSLPGKKIFAPIRLARERSITPDYALVEEAYLEFSVPPENANQIAFVFPDATVSGGMSPLRVAPVRFARAGQFAGKPKPEVMPCLYSTDPPSMLEAAQLQALPPPLSTKPLKAAQLTGTWIVDGKASAESVRNWPPPSMDEFLSVAGWVFLFVYDFGDGVVTLGTYTGDKKMTYRLVPEQSSRSKLVYKSEIPHGTDDDLLTVSAADGNNISVSSFPGNFSFKRVKLDPKIKDQDTNRALESLQEFMKAVSPAPTGAGK